MDTMKTIRKEIKDSPLSQREISRQTGINIAAIHRIMVQGTGLTAESCDKLLNFFGYELTKKRGLKNGKCD